MLAVGATITVLYVRESFWYKYSGVSIFVSLYVWGFDLWWLCQMNVDVVIWLADRLPPPSCNCAGYFWLSCFMYDTLPIICFMLSEIVCFIINKHSSFVCFCHYFVFLLLVFYKFLELLNLKCLWLKIGLWIMLFQMCCSPPPFFKLVLHSWETSVLHCDREQGLKM